MTPLFALIRQAVLSDMRSVSKDYKPDLEKEARNLSSSSTTLTGMSLLMFAKLATGIKASDNNRRSLLVIFEIFIIK
jgi:hypothetical protein